MHAAADSDDHLSLVAGMRRNQIAKFEAAGITRVAELAEATDEKRPKGMTPETFVKRGAKRRCKCAAVPAPSRFTNCSSTCRRSASR